MTELLRSYSSFISQLVKHDILDADTFKPLLKGTDLAKALSVKPGPWMKDALDVVMAWQLRNPSTTDPAEAIKAVRIYRESESELSQRLASHFLKLTIPPFFPQTKSDNAFDISQKPAPWKDPHNKFVLELLRWSIQSLDRKAIEQNWHLLVPPVLKMLDDTSVEHKARGCQYLRYLLATLKSRTNKDASIIFLERTGYHEVFASTLWPLLTYIPSLTPEAESVTVFESVYDPLRSLAELLKPEDKRCKFLDKLMREGVLAPLSHFPTPATYPDLACVIIDEIPRIASMLGIETIKHLPSLTPLLTGIMQDPFILSRRELTLATILALQSVMETCWPRIPAHRGAIALGLCVLKGRCDDESGRLPKSQRGNKEAHEWSSMENILQTLKDTAGMLDILLSQSEVSKEWVEEKKALVEADEGLEAFFQEDVW